MQRHLPSVVIAVLVSCAVVWGWSVFGSSGHGGVAVVDLDEVARRLGRQEEMQHSVETVTENLNGKLTAMKEDANRKLEVLKSQIGPNPTGDKAKAFQQVTVQTQLELNKQKQVAEVALGQHKQQLVRDFRKESRPFTERVARQRGFGTVVPKNDALVLTHTENVDITDEVYQAMLAAGHNAAPRPAAAPATAPAAEQFAPQAAPPIQQAGFETPAN